MSWSTRSRSPEIHRNFGIIRYRDGKTNNVGWSHARSTGPGCGEYSHPGFISRYVKAVDTGRRENADRNIDHHSKYGDRTSHHIGLAQIVHHNPRLKDEPGSGQRSTARCLRINSSWSEGGYLLPVHFATTQRRRFIVTCVHTHATSVTYTHNHCKYSNKLHAGIQYHWFCCCPCSPRRGWYIRHSVPETRA